MYSSLRIQAKSGMLWSFMIQGGTQIINFAVTIILARLLLPEDFGLIGMIAVFIAIARALVDGGFVSSLIRTKDANNLDYSTVFFTNLIASILLYVILYFSAPIVADFYDQEILINIIRVLSLVIIFNAFSLVQSAKLNKDLNFKTQFKLTLPALIFSALVSIWMAYRGYGVWSLVIKDLTFSLIATLLLWYHSTWIPSLQFKKEKFRYHFNFGYKLSLTQIVNTIFQNLYKVLIGKFFSAAQLSYFTRAKSLEELPTGFFYSAFNRVAYPMLAKIDDEKKVKQVYSRLLKLIVFLVTPILLYLFIVSEPFIVWLLTDKWIAASPYFKILVLSGIFFPIHKYNLNICNLKGRSDIVLKLSMLQNTLLLIGGLSAIWWGVYGLVYSVLIVNILVTIINAFFSGRLINYNLKEQFKDLYPTFLINSITCAFSYFLFVSIYNNSNHLESLVVVGATFLCLYTITSYLFKLNAFKDLIKTIRNR